MKFGLSITAVALLIAGSAIGFSGRGNAQSAPAAGETIFKQRCAACHTVASGAPNRVGPNLAGVVGRKAGSATFNYSPALQKADWVWSKANLDRYLTAPTKMVPGTRMAAVLPNQDQRAAVIAYLAQTKK